MNKPLSKRLRKIIDECKDVMKARNIRAYQDLCAIDAVDCIRNDQPINFKMFKKHEWILTCGMT